MKKVMAVCGLLSTGLFIWHSILAVKYFYGELPNKHVLDAVGGMLAICMTMHLIPALMNMFKNIRKTKGQISYPKYIIDNVLQNITGISVVCLMIVHIMAIQLNRALHSNSSGIIWWAADLLFYLAICIHLAITLPHVLITYGITTNKIPYNIARTAICVISAVGFLMYSYSHTVFCFKL